MQTNEIDFMTQVIQVCDAMLEPCSEQSAKSAFKILLREYPYHGISKEELNDRFNSFYEIIRTVPESVIKNAVLEACKRCTSFMPTSSMVLDSSHKFTEKITSMRVSCVRLVDKYNESLV